MLKQVKASKETAAAGEGLETLATLPLGANRSLHLVRAGDEIVLLGAAEHGVAPIRTLQRGRGPRARPDRRPADRTVPTRATLASLEPAGAQGLHDALRSKTVIK